jgi:3-hydroxybutyrate dehydrogenase
MALLAGHHAVVTGGGRGIGRAVAAALTRNGAAVTVVGRAEAALDEATRRGDAAGYIVADVTDARAVSDGLARAAATRGPVAILVANAGAAETAPFGKIDPDQFRRMFDVNVMGVVHASRAVLGGMVERGFGRIVAVASTAGLKGYAYASAYCAAKHAVVGLVRALAIETAKTGVTVNAVCPGYTDTDLVRDSVARISQKTGRPPEEALAALLKDSPLGRLVRPDEVAAAVLSLCAPGATAITGQTLAVAGGEV